MYSVLVRAQVVEGWIVENCMGAQFGFFLRKQHFTGCSTNYSPQVYSV